MGYHEMAKRYYKSQLRFLERLRDQSSDMSRQQLERLIARCRSSRSWHRARACAQAEVPADVAALAEQARAHKVQARAAEKAGDQPARHAALARYRGAMVAAGHALRRHLHPELEGGVTPCPRTMNPVFWVASLEDLQPSPVESPRGA